MGFKRRSLLKASALTLAGWTLSGGRWSEQSRRYSDALGAPAERKFALLVGINHYGGDIEDCPRLRGCLNDLELQRNLLIHRFGFLPDNILTLTNRQATRSQVQTAVINHLLNQVGPNDTALFHFSGYGSMARTSDSDNFQRTLVLQDSCGDGEVLKDWPEEHLTQLLGAIASDRVLAVLDSSNALPAAGISSEALRVRSRPIPPATPFDELHQTLQAQLQEALTSKAGKTIKTGKDSDTVILRASQLRDSAVEFESQMGPVGLLTYCLSQQLWQSGELETLGSTLEGITARIQQNLGLNQQPQLSNARLQKRQLNKLGLTGFYPSGSAGAITAAKRDGGLQLWLGGFSAEALAYCEAGAILRVEAPLGQPSGSALPVSRAGIPRQYFRIQDRDGMIATATPLRSQDRIALGLSEPALSGGSEGPSQLLSLHQSVREQIRMIPRDLVLQVSLDKRLNRIERVDATSALTSVPSISVVSPHNSPTDYVFGRVVVPEDSFLATLPDELPDGGLPNHQPGQKATGLSSNSVAPVLPEVKYGLLLLNQQSLPATVSASAEAIKTAIQRLQPYLETLRAEKALQLLENTASSGLAIEVRWATLRAVKGGKPEETALRLAQGNRTSAQPIPVAQLSPGDQVRYSFQNQGDSPLFVMLLGVNSLGQWLMPFNPTAESGDESYATKLGQPGRLKASITAGNNFNTPIAPGDSVKGEWPVESQKGLTSLYVIAIAAPFNKSYALLSGQKQDLVEAQRLQRLRDPFELAESLLSDLQAASASDNPAFPLEDSHYALNTDAWATFRYSYEVG